MMIVDTYIVKIRRELTNLWQKSQIKKNSCQAVYDEQNEGEKGLNFTQVHQVTFVEDWTQFIQKTDFSSYCQNRDRNRYRNVVNAPLVSTKNWLGRLRESNWSSLRIAQARVFQK